MSTFLSPQNSSFRRKSFHLHTPNRSVVNLNISANESILFDDEQVSERTVISTKSPRQSLSNISNATNKSIASKFSQTEIVEHYQNCIQMINTNKVSAKNAFNLHLIDLIKKVLPQEEMNFQMAGCTVDAGAKIYAYRVDCLHGDTYKVLSNLGKNQASQDQETLDSTTELETADGTQEQTQSQRTEKKRKKRSNFKAIEENLDRIHKKTSFESFTDALSAKASALFDAGSSHNLLVNNLPSRVIGDKKRLIIDGKQISDIALPSETRVETETIDPQLLKIPKLPNHNLLNRRFLQFCFTDDSSAAEILNPIDESLMVDVDAAPLGSEGNDGLDAVGFSDDGDVNEDVENIENIPMNATQVSGVSISTLQEHGIKRLFDGKEGLAKFLSNIESNEFPFLNQRYIRALRNKYTIYNDQGDRDSSQGKRPRKSKTQQFITFDHDEEKYTKFFSSSKKATILAKATINSYKNKKYTMPLMGFNYNKDRFSSFFKNEIEMFVLQEVFDEGQAGLENDQTIVNNSMLHMSMESAHHDGFDDANSMDYEGPDKVESEQIDYARRSKNIDMKKLKGAIWKKLTTKEEQDNVDESTPPEETNTVTGAYEFHKLCSELPNLVSNKMKRDLSVAINFVSLLHLANEKNLRLTQTDFTDFSISQDP